MQEYRWFIRDNTALTIAADRGRFQTDNEAIGSAALLLDRHPTAAVLEIWRGSKLIGRTVRDDVRSSPKRMT